MRILTRCCSGLLSALGGSAAAYSSLVLGSVAACFSIVPVPVAVLRLRRVPFLFGRFQGCTMSLQGLEGSFQVSYRVLLLGLEGTFLSGPRL